MCKRQRTGRPKNRWFHLGRKGGEVGAVQRKAVAVYSTRNGGPGRIWTGDLPISTQALYPSELRGHAPNCTRQKVRIGNIFWAFCFRGIASGFCSQSASDFVWKVNGFVSTNCIVDSATSIKPAPVFHKDGSSCFVQRRRRNRERQFDGGPPSTQSWRRGWGSVNLLPRFVLDRVAATRTRITLFRTGSRFEARSPSVWIP